MVMIAATFAAAPIASAILARGRANSLSGYLSWKRME